MRVPTTWLLMMGSALAGEASVRESFHIDASHDEVVAWLDSHQDDCRAALNIRLEEQAGDVLTLKRQNRRGLWRWRQRDIVTSEPGRWHLQSTLVECLEGGIQALASDVVLTADGQRTLVSATSTAEVDGVTTKELRIDLHGRGRRLRELLQREVEK